MSYSKPLGTADDDLVIPPRFVFFIIILSAHDYKYHIHPSSPSRPPRLLSKNMVSWCEQEILANDGVAAEEERRKRLFKGLKFFFGREVRMGELMQALVVVVVVVLSEAVEAMWG